MGSGWPSYGHLTASIPMLLRKPQPSVLYNALGALRRAIRYRMPDCMVLIVRLLNIFWVRTLACPSLRLHYLPVSRTRC